MNDEALLCVWPYAAGNRFSALDTKGNLDRREVFCHSTFNDSGYERYEGSHLNFPYSVVSHESVYINLFFDPTS
jgi:hypothetical protein